MAVAINIVKRKIIFGNIAERVRIFFILLYIAEINDYKLSIFLIIVNIQMTLNFPSIL